MASSSTSMPRPRLLGELGQHGRQAAARGVAQEAQRLLPAARARRADGGLDEAPERRAVAAHVGAEVELAARREDGDGVVADAAAEDHGVAVAHGGGAELVRDDDLPDARSS